MVFDPASIAARDPGGMLRLISLFPRMCTEAWSLASGVSPPPRPRAVVVAGMGGSGIGGDLLRAVLYEEAAPPVVVVKDYRVPGWVGPETLLFACSYSGETEETLAAYQEAAGRGARCVAITSGGSLLRRARERGDPAVVVPPGLPPRAALPYMFLPMVAILAAAGAVRSFDEDAAEAADVAASVAEELAPGRPENPARALADSLVGRLPLIYSATPLLEPAAQRWKDQINENAKTLAAWNTFPELNHNETVGWGLDPDLARRCHVVILRDPREPPRLARRVAITRDLAFCRAAGVDEVWARGRGLLARLCSIIVVGDFVSWYLALLRGVDPTPVPVIDELKRRLAQA
ncbi:MAG: bifunctional phosphoglucose/phosphomannose isomerase [Armatimonadota bacterium]|nr:bifunctional phosphoglucose/phosphomannose isomerase [Armatimonadota bacterium]MDR7401930.1 bifunctional phosphoglucose/phosphomannose isomerase [Armatimonadota bacterium]MDR7403689.1 bifunctional phosphoglucose/phosphomannose isomerase [Armatimonadota bacterium]MDR7438217.1 bifunctional phosphoglucose/phosphomannose isomerase [Armatimonadota bacterium]MDR7471519.1 bifunctional phosphoglucose/phosphomannose isomerase [Armatimonadota bacterium]